MLTASELAHSFLRKLFYGLHCTTNNKIKKYNPSRMHFYTQVNQVKCRIKPKRRTETI